MKICLLVFILFFFLYGVNFTFLPISTARIILLTAGGYLLLKSLFYSSVIINRSVLLIFALYAILLLWITFITVFYQLRDVTIFTGALLMFIHSFIGGWFLAVIFDRFNFDLRNVILFVPIVITIQAVFIIVYFLSWSFREFTFAFIPEAGNIDYRKNLFQSRGLTHSSGASLSVLQSFGVLFTSYLLSTANFRSKQFIYLSFSFGLLCISIFLTGRTGLLILPLVFIYFFIILFLRIRIPKNITYFILAAPLIILISFLVFRFLYSNYFGGITTAGGEDILSRVVRWYVEEFYSEGRIQSRTLSFLSTNHLIFPENNIEILFGDPTTWHLNRISSDIGYIRMWHGIGLVGILIYYSFIITLFIHMILLAPDSYAKIMLTLLLIYLLIIEFKEPFMLNLSINAFFILLFSYLLVKDINDKEKISNEDFTSH
jgi:hypothetical protein